MAKNFLGTQREQLLHTKKPLQREAEAGAVHQAGAVFPYFPLRAKVQCRAKLGLDHELGGICFPNSGDK